MRNHEEEGSAVAVATAPAAAKARRWIETKAARKPFKPVKVGFKDTSTGTVFYVTGPLAPVFKAQRLGLGMTQTKVAELAGVCNSTVARRETDMNVKGSWGYLRTNVHILNALGLQVMGVSGA